MQKKSTLAQELSAPVEESLIESDVPPIRAQLNPANRFDPKRLCHVCDRPVGHYAHFKLPGRDVYFHPDHLVCRACGDLVGETGFYTDDSGFHCGACFFAANPVTCALCRGPIRANYVQIGETCFHKKCLRCSSCDRRIGSECFMLPPPPVGSGDEEGARDMFCRECFDKAHPFCWKCDTRIIEKRFEVCSQTYLHPNCFCCAKCGQMVGQKKFLLDRDNKGVICERCLDQN